MAAMERLGKKLSPARRPWEDLPEDCWESIFGRFDHHCHLQPSSLVNKRFLIRTTLTIPSPASISSLPLSQLYSRFPNVQSLHLSHPHPSLDVAVRELAQSNLPPPPLPPIPFPPRCHALIPRLLQYHVDDHRMHPLSLPDRRRPPRCRRLLLLPPPFTL